jgi:catechol 2,3-dioxygenase-like lactoylglutathione lyase family enzyme
MPSLRGFHHVKLPVTDVEHSRDWYMRLSGFEVELEFVEDGVLMGVALRDPSGTVPLALRGNPERAEALSGFDPIAIGVADTAELGRWRERLESSVSRTAASSPATSARCWWACTTRTASRYGSTPSRPTSPDQPSRADVPAATTCVIGLPAAARCTRRGRSTRSHFDTPPASVETTTSS